MPSQLEVGLGTATALLTGNFADAIALPIIMELANDAVTSATQGLVDKQINKQEDSTKQKIQSQLAAQLTAVNVQAMLNGFLGTNLAGLPINITVGDLLTAIGGTPSLFTEVWDSPPPGVDAAVAGGRGVNVAATVRFNPNTDHLISGRIEVPPSECLPRDTSNIVRIPGQPIPNDVGVVGQPCDKFFGGPHPVRTVLGGKPSRVLGKTDPSLDWAETKTTGTWDVHGSVFEFGGKLWCRVLGENVPDRGMMIFDGIETGRGAPASQVVVRGSFGGANFVADGSPVHMTPTSELSYQELAIPNPGVGSSADCVFKIDIDVDRTIGFLDRGISWLGTPQVTEISIPAPAGTRKVKVLTVDPVAVRAGIVPRVWAITFNPHGAATQVRQRVIIPHSTVPTIDFPDIPLFRFSTSDVILVRPEFGTFDSGLLLSELADAASLPGIARGLPDLAFPWAEDDTFVLDRVVDSMDALRVGLDTTPTWPSFVDFLTCPFRQPTSLSASDPYVARLLGEVRWARETESQRYVPVDLLVFRVL